MATTVSTTPIPQKKVKVPRDVIVRTPSGRYVSFVEDPDKPTSRSSRLKRAQRLEQAGVFADRKQQEAEEVLKESKEIKEQQELKSEQRFQEEKQQQVVERRSFNIRDVAVRESIFPKEERINIPEGKISVQGFVEQESSIFFGGATKPILESDFILSERGKQVLGTKVQGSPFTDIGKFIGFSPALATTPEALSQAISRGGLRPVPESITGTAKITQADKLTRIETATTTQIGGSKIVSGSQQIAKTKGIPSGKFTLGKIRGVTIKPFKRPPAPSRKFPIFKGEQGVTISKFKSLGVSRDMGRVQATRIFKPKTGEPIIISKDLKAFGSISKTATKTTKITTVKQGFDLPGGNMFKRTKVFGKPPIDREGVTGVLGKKTFIGETGRIGRIKDANIKLNVINVKPTTKTDVNFIKFGAKTIQQPKLISKSLGQQTGATSSAIQQEVAKSVSIFQPIGQGLKTSFLNIGTVIKPLKFNLPRLKTSTQEIKAQRAPSITVTQVPKPTKQEPLTTTTTTTGQRGGTKQFLDVVTIPKQDQPPKIPEVFKFPEPQQAGKTNIFVPRSGLDFGGGKFGFLTPPFIPSGIPQFSKSQAIGTRAFGRTPSFGAALKLDFGFKQPKFKKQFEMTGLFERAFI